VCTYAMILGLALAPNFIEEIVQYQACLYIYIYIKTSIAN
jgi:hypothetical protein